ncbi:hypothetical protein SAMN05443245_1167 [Paraburkholderia fungorum]|uniref:Uncharacterized protein n=1 Tax=Paraburkholderia fungorum TaxID=134537 RepID=A0A1H1AFN0_9BURK|nr:hypothetical protein SAMN05443245_1167 [Paraburkholderia fungorum]
MKAPKIKLQEISTHVALAVTFIGVLSLTACGGGGSSGSAATTPANLSAVQQNYESFTLASNGGAHYLRGSLLISSSSTGALTVSPSSSLFTQDSSLPQSPATSGPQMLTTGMSTVASGFAVPTLTPDRYLVNGAVVTEAIPAQVQVSYVGDNVQETDYATDGKTVTMTLLGTNYTNVPLSGAISASPSELFDDSALGLITNTVNGSSLYNKSATWQAGAAYMKVTRQVVGDTVFVGDCVAPATTGNNITPCSTTISTLEAFFPFTSANDGKTYNLSDGQIVTLAGGIRAWVANTLMNTATPEYRVLYQNNGEIFEGALMKDGTTLSLFPAGSTTAQNFYIFLNKAAVQSISSALTF